MKNLLIVYHTQTGNTERLARAALAGACDDQIEGVEPTLLRAAAAGPEALLKADGLLLATPENFGYMSGGMKDFLDRTFYPVEGQIGSLPYALMVSCGNDGTGAVRAIQRIAPGYPLIEIQPPIIARGEVTADHERACRELGMLLAAGLEAGIY